MGVSQPKGIRWYLVDQKWWFWTKGIVQLVISLHSRFDQSMLLIFIEVLMKSIKLLKKKYFSVPSFINWKLQ